MAIFGTGSCRSRQKEVTEEGHCTTYYTLHTTHYTIKFLNYTLHTTHFNLQTTHYTLHTTHCTLHTCLQEELLATGDPKFCHLREPLHLQVTCTSDHSTRPNYTAQCCTVLHCRVLHCTALHSNTLYCTAEFCTVLHCTALHRTVLHIGRLWINLLGPYDAILCILPNSRFKFSP